MFQHETFHKRKNSKLDKDGVFKDLNIEFGENFKYVLRFYEENPNSTNRFTVQYVRQVLLERLAYPIGRQQCLIYMARLGYKVIKPTKQNLIPFSARIKRLKVIFFVISNPDNPILSRYSSTHLRIPPSF